MIARSAGGSIVQSSTSGTSLRRHSPQLCSGVGNGDCSCEYGAWQAAQGAHRLMGRRTGLDGMAAADTGAGWADAELGGIFKRAAVPYAQRTSRSFCRESCSL